MTFAAIKSGWRPAFGWVFVFFFAGLSVVMLFLLATGMVELADASNIIVAMIGAGGMVTGIYVGGRSYEKGNGQSRSEYEYEAAPRHIGDEHAG